MNIYLDIDGVLINDTLEGYGTPTRHSVELLKYLTGKFDCFWLTTHCKDGECRVEQYLGQRLPAEAMQYIKLIRPTFWQNWKTEAIDFNQDFRWIDDELYVEERKALTQRGCLGKVILLNLQKNPEQLKEVIAHLIT